MARLFFSKPEVPSKIDNHVAAAAPGDQFLYEEDWGEKYDGVSSKSAPKRRLNLNLASAVTHDRPLTCCFLMERNRCILSTRGKTTGAICEEARLAPFVKYSHKSLQNLPHDSECIFLVCVPASRCCKVSRLGLFVADLSGTGKVEQIPGISAELTPGQPRFSPDGTHIVYTGWQCEPRKLGMIYCYQRPCNLYSAPVAEMLMNMERENDTPDNREVDGSSEAQQKEAGPNDEQNAKSSEMEQKQGKPKTHKCLCPSWRLARSARFSPSGDRLIWLSREEGFDTHGGCFRLTSAPWDVKAGNINVGALKTLVDIVRVPDTSSDGAGFPGLWVDSLPDACFTPDGSSVYVTSAWGSRQSVVKVDVETGLVERVVAATAAARQDSTIGDSNDASASVLAVGKGGVYVAGSSPNSPGGFAVVSPQTGEPIVGPAIGGALVTSSVRIKRGHIAKLKTALGGVRWSVLSVPVGEAPQQEPPFEAILLMPPSAPQQMTESASPKGESSKVPLVVVPHGGPHGVIPTVFIPAYAFLCATQGVAVIHVNFRGSTGFGTEALDSLPGRIGTNDVADVVSATKAALALESDRLDPERVGVIGGSHGGFLGAHLTAQHPEIFKVAALRNPVTNIASMVTVSDIPDWCYIEALGRGKYDFGACRPPTAEELRTMWEMSPVKHVKGVKAPTLVALGAKDRRVPQSQGLEWYRALRSQGVEARLLIYPDDVHAIDQPASEADQWLNIIAWFNTHLG